MIPENWNEIIAGLPGASLLQTSQWAEVKARMGWEAFPKSKPDCVSFTSPGDR